MQRLLHFPAFPLLCVRTSSSSLRKVFGEFFLYCAGFRGAGHDPQHNLPHPRPRIQSLARIPTPGHDSILNRPPASSGGRDRIRPPDWPSLGLDLADAGIGLLISPLDQSGRPMGRGGGGAAHCGLISRYSAGCGGRGPAGRAIRLRTLLWLRLPLPARRGRSSAQ